MNKHHPLRLFSKTFTSALIGAAFCFGAGALIGCSSIDKANIPASANPSEEVSTLEKDIQTGYARHFDLLAAEDFENSQDHLDKAKKALGTDRKQEKILDDVRYARAYYDRAAATAAKRSDKVAGILNARADAVNAGAHKFPKWNKELVALDNKVRRNAKDFERELSPEEFTRLQKGYLDLELAAIQSTHLDKSRALIHGAEERGAKNLTPKSLRKAELSLRNAEAEILANRHSPETFGNAVVTAEADAMTLDEVLKVAKDPKRDLDEATAMRIVASNRKISTLENQLGESASTQAEMNTALERRNRQLRSAANAVQMQNAIETARQSFSEDQAEAFQQGNNLILRLKSFGFAVNQAELPTASLPLLAKVKDVTAELNPTRITVEGHTDSVGAASANKKLSQARAEAVAAYLKTNGFEEVEIEAIGYGFDRPIASNKTKESRAQNRRVDLVITPSTELPVRTPSSL